MNLSNLDSINIIKLPFFEEDRGDLTVIEELNQCPFSIARAFSVRLHLIQLEANMLIKNAISF